jgi:hypothetical protein
LDDESVRLIMHAQSEENDGIGLVLAVGSDAGTRGGDIADLTVGLPQFPVIDGDENFVYRHEAGPILLRTIYAQPVSPCEMPNGRSVYRGNIRTNLGLFDLNLYLFILQLLSSLVEPER